MMKLTGKTGLGRFDVFVAGESDARRVRVRLPRGKNVNSRDKEDGGWCILNRLGSPKWKSQLKIPAKRMLS